MDISNELTIIADNLEKGHYDVVVQRTLLLIEQKLREVVKHDLPHLKGSEQLKVFAYFTEKKKSLDELTMGEVVGLLRETKFLEGWKQRNQKELQVFETIDLNKLIALRNATAHGKSLVYTRIDAELMIVYQRLIFQTFNHAAMPVPELPKVVVPALIEEKPVISIPAVVKKGEFRDKLKDGTDAPAMVWLPKGKFMMGSNEYDDEKPIHEVTIDYELAVGKFPVTVAEFRRFVQTTSYKTEAERGDGAWVYTGQKWEQKADANWKNPYLRQTNDHPVVCVSWNDAKEYCEWLSDQTGASYRLLSEAEWEYACRAGSTGKYCFGDDVHQLGSYAWFSGNSGGKTHPVGEKKPNAFGLHDMHGNVWEWCEDVWHENYNGAPTDGNAWIVGGDSNKHRFRGGSWFNYGYDLRCAIRNGDDSTYGGSDGGLRFSRM